MRETCENITQDDPEEDDEPHDEQRELPLWMQNYVTQAKGDTPANNTRARRSITTEIMLVTLEVSQTHARPQQLASRKFPTQLFVEMANAVLDSTTGDLLEYRHLLKNSKYSKT